MAPTKCRAACLWGFIFSLLLSGCIPEAQREGGKLYAAKCSSCHRLLPPTDYSLDKFGAYIEKYGKGLTAEEKGRIMDFLKAVKELE